MEQTLKAMFDKYVKEPVLKVWTPSEWDLKYYGKTAKRLAKEQEKRSVQNKREYDMEMVRYAENKRCFNEILSAPAELKDFFVRTIVGAVESARTARATLLARKTELTAKYDKDFLVVGQTYHFNPTHVSHCLASIYDNVMKHGEEFYENPVNRSHYFNYYLSLSSNPNERKEMAREIDELYGLYKKIRDVPSSYSIITDYSASMARMLATMRSVLGGNPEGVERGQHWGLNGHYNGVVFGNGNRASFKSFLAGGWNIQRLHVRFRVTLLKERTARAA